MIILPIIWFLKFFLLSCFRLVFLPTTLISLPPGVMLLNCSTAPKGSATEIEKTSGKGAPERERPNISVVKTISFDLRYLMVFHHAKDKSYTDISTLLKIPRQLEISCDVLRKKSVLIIIIRILIIHKSLLSGKSDSYCRKKRQILN